jgi:Tfp pilus assembly protein PilZ
MPEGADILDDSFEVGRRNLWVRVRFRTSDGDRYEGFLSSVGEHGLFIEHHDPLPVGTELKLEFVPPGGSSERLKAKGVVAWVCPHSDQYAFSRGIGVRLTEVLESHKPATFSHLLMLYMRTH